MSMSDEVNGISGTAQGIVILWDEAAQDVTIKFDPNQFKNWDFVIGVLELAKRKAEKTDRMLTAQTLQKQAFQAAQEAAVRGKLLRG